MRIERKQNVYSTIQFKKDGDKYVSLNFKVREFRCKDGSDKILISPETISILQSIRSYFGKPVTINSTYRTSSYNKKVGITSKSQHVAGTACDIKVDGVSPTAVAAYVEAYYPITGFGLYSTFVHVDTRGYKVRWKNSGSNTVFSFNLGDIYVNYKAKPQDNQITEEEFAQMMEVYLSEVAEEKPNAWSKEECDWAVKNGYFQGDESGMRWKSNITREEIAVLEHRIHNKE